MKSSYNIPKASGVYCAYQGDVCIYVGSSRCLQRRIKNHNLKSKCDRWEWREVPTDRLKEEEQFLIDSLQPRLNVNRATRPCSDRNKSGISVSVSFWLPDDLLECLQEFSEASHERPNYIVRRLIAEHLLIKRAVK